MFNTSDQLLHAIIKNDTFRKTLTKHLAKINNDNDRKYILFDLFNGLCNDGLSKGSIKLFSTFAQIYRDRLQETHDGQTILHYIIDKIGSSIDKESDNDNIEENDNDNIEENDNDDKKSDHDHNDMIVSFIDIIINLGFNVNTKDTNGETILYYAAKLGSNKVIDRIVKVTSLDTNICNINGRSILSASENVSVSILGKLVSIGVDPHIKDNNGLNILGWFHWNSVEEVKYCIEDLKVECSDKQFRHIKWTDENIEILKYLMNRSEITDYVGMLKNAEGANAIKYIIDSGKLSDIQIHHYLRKIVGGSKHYLRKIVGGSKEFEIAKHIIDKIEDINKVRYDGGLNILHVCNDLDILKYIKDNTKIDPHHLADDGKSTLHFFHRYMRRRVLGTMKFLIEEMKVDPLVRDIDNNTLLHFDQNDDVIDYLCKYIDINATNKYGMTPLHSCTRSHPDADIREIIKEKTDLNATDNNGMTPLHYAISSQFILECLAKYNVNPNILDKNGKAPLHYAIKHACQPYIANYGIVVDLLEMRGIDPNIKDANGATPFDYATRYGNDIFNTGEKIKKLLLDATKKLSILTPSTRTVKRSKSHD